MKFKELHHQEKPLLLANVWDVPSSKIAEKLNFKAVGTSSSAIATVLGYEDGEQMAFSELEYFVKRITENINIPLSVDLESGYSRNPKKIVTHIERLVEMGVAGINLEDSIVVNGNRTLLNLEHFSKTLSMIKNELEKKGCSIFINVRTDTFLLKHEDVLEETQRRVSSYEKVGVDGLFIPFIEKESDIKTILKQTNLPLNVLCVPNLPDFDRLTELGIKRISMGNFVFNRMYRDFETRTQEIINKQSFKSIF